MSPALGRVTPRRRGAVGCVTLSVLAVGAYPVVPRASVWQAAAFVVCAGASALALFLGSRATPDHVAWRILAIGTALNTAASAFWWRANLSPEPPLLSPTDPLYMVGYSVVIVGLWRLSRGATIEGFAAAAIIVSGAGVLSWLFLIGPAAQGEGTSRLARAVAIFYPAADLMMLLFALRLLSRRRPPMYALLLGTAFMGFVISDTFYGLGLAEGTYRVGGLTDLGWVATYAGIGAAVVYASRGEAGVTAAGRQLSRAQRILSVATATAVVIGALVGIVNLQHQARVGRDAATRIEDLQFSLLKTDALVHDLLERRASAGLLDVVRVERVLESEQGIRRSFVERTQKDPGHASLFAEYGAALAELLGLPPTAPRDQVIDLEEGYEESRDAVLAHLEEDRDERDAAARRDENTASTGSFLLVALAAVMVTMLVRRLWSAERAVAFQRLSVSEARAAAILDSARDGFVSLDDAGVVRGWNKRSAELFGWSAEEVLGRPYAEVEPLRRFEPGSVGLPSADAVEPAGASSEQRFTRRDGGGFLAEVITWVTEDDDGRYRNAFISDVTERSRLQEELGHLAFHDALTDLPNRALFNDRLEHALQSRSKPGRFVSVIAVDLNGFKALNDTLGHAAGDRALIQVGRGLTSVVRPQDTVARIGGDEFAILLEEADLDGAIDVVERIATVFRRPPDAGGVTVRASMGVAFATPGDDVRSVMQHADVAMFVAKERGEDRYEVWSPAIHSAIVERQEMETDLNGVVERGELVVEFQPTVDLATQRVVGSEALVRWNRPTRGRIRPGVFIPIAEECGAIGAIGTWVLEEACAQTVTWSHRHTAGGPLGVAVNLSVRQIANPRLVAVIGAILERTGLDPDLLTLEVTETAVAQDPEQMMVALGRLRSLGVKLALDDFGTGYSSLSYLRRLPIDTLKIDRSFITGIAEDDQQWALVSGVIRLARSLGKTTVAEGIETGAQLAHVRSLRCDLAQGNYFSKPLSVADFDALLADPRLLARRDSVTALGAAVSVSDDGV